MILSGVALGICKQEATCLAGKKPRGCTASIVNLSFEGFGREGAWQ
jgi:hypothetical protein